MFEHLVEERIQAAIARGDFDHLPGIGKPLDLDDDRVVPEHLRAGLRILKNAGLVPPQLADLRELSDLQSVLLADGIEDRERHRARLRLGFLLARLETAGLLHTSRTVLRRYQEALLDRLGEAPPGTGVPEKRPGA